MEHHLKTPISEETVRGLKIGDIMYLSGDAYSGSMAIPHIINALKAGKELPFELEDRIFSLGFTTSARYQANVPELLRLSKFRVTYAKGGMNKECLDTFQDVGCVYGTVIGGTGWLYPKVEQVPTNWPEEIEEPRRSVFRLVMKDYGPLFVTMDANGNSLAHELERRNEERMPEILKRLDAWPIEEPYHLTIKHALGV
jgi:tartrate dehydratase beta subunit/fumarate hydratase class I family protein